MYLSDLLYPYIYTPMWSLRSSGTGQLSIPHTNLPMCGDRAVSVAVPTLPLAVDQLEDWQFDSRFPQSTCRYVLGQDT